MSSKDGSQMRWRFSRISRVTTLLLAILCMIALSGCSTLDGILPNTTAGSQPGQDVASGTGEPAVPNKRAGSHEGYIAICQMYVSIDSLNKSFADAVRNIHTKEGEVAFNSGFMPSFTNAFMQDGPNQGIVASPLFAAASQDSAYEQDYNLLLDAARILKERADAYQSAISQRAVFNDPHPGEIEEILQKAIPARPDNMPPYPEAKVPFEIGKYLDAGGIYPDQDLREKLSKLGLNAKDGSYVTPGSQVMVSLHHDSDEVKRIIAGTDEITGPEYVKAAAAFFGLELDGPMDKSGNVYDQNVKYGNKTGEIIYIHDGETEDLTIILGDDMGIL